MKALLVLLFPVAAFSAPLNLDCVNARGDVIQLRHFTQDGILFTQMTLDSKTEWVDGPSYFREELVRNYYGTNVHFTVQPTGDANLRRIFPKKDGRYTETNEAFVCEGL